MQARNDEGWAENKNCSDIQFNTNPPKAGRADLPSSARPPGSLFGLLLLKIGQTSPKLVPSMSPRWEQSGSGGATPQTPQRSPHTIPCSSREGDESQEEPQPCFVLVPSCCCPGQVPDSFFYVFYPFLFPNIHVCGTPEPFPSPLGTLVVAFPQLGSGFGVLIPLNLSIITQMCWNHPVLQPSISIPCCSGFSEAYLWISVWWVKKSPL